MQKLRTHWSHREPRMTSRLLLRMMIALIGLFLLMQLSGCGSTRTVYVQAPVIPLPSNLTAETPKPKVSNSMSWSDSLLLNARLYSALRQCNLDKVSIRRIEVQRSK
ncbi:MAG: Rz1 lytic protein [Enterobacteriaceae bacterium]|uniref:Rz1-like lysis system protein LysC n=1 Tax=Hafnia paralvei TaxID=546367 RepID=UPI000EE756AC|nr:Rz1 lytic protein [Hafnia paralvei]MDU1193108.1 Rz1 lytic protein [Enterobacteriaceae bacterium]MDU1245198.1 Rz1 lytic protein [Enterobacteriaceae bacterium]HCU16507.1 Rz1 lytic protein [Hafnia paralvei]